MELHRLKCVKGTGRRKKRVGRGQGSGKGGTATRGYNGAQSRSGYKVRAHLEGGQTPLQRRMPKGGFKKFRRIRVKPVSLARLESLAVRAQCDQITTALLVKHRVIQSGDRYKIVGNKLAKKLDVAAPLCSRPARLAIAAQGGVVLP